MGIASAPHVLILSFFWPFTFFMFLDKLEIPEHKVNYVYIIFKYNENDMEEARKLASKAGVRLNFVKSVRWDGEMSKYRPTNKNNYFTREFSSDYGGSPY